MSLPIKEQQQYLSMIGLYRGSIDGIPGKLTREASIEFCEREGVGVDRLSESLLKKIKAMKPSSYSDRDSLLIALIDLCHHVYLYMPEQLAYIMATVEHETAGKFQPVREAFYLPNKSGRDRYLKSTRYYPYFGRGLVQLTWDYNYKKYQEILGVDLTSSDAARDQALDPAYSLFILVHGMKTGHFTGKSLEDYISDRGVNYVGARRVINGTDKDKKIAELAKKWEVKVKEHYEKLGDIGLNSQKSSPLQEPNFAGWDDSIGSSDFEYEEPDLVDIPPPVYDSPKQDQSLDPEYEKFKREKAQREQRELARQEYARVQHENSKPKYKSKILGFAATTLLSFIATRYGLSGFLTPEVISVIETLIVSGGAAGIAAARVWFTKQTLR